jgi:fibro-slime domain-containing protein/LPXTG-motif cell wall-anchored protein
MKKSRLLNRTLSFGLALALFISSPASLYAEEMNDASVETIVENIDQGGASGEGESSGSDSTTASEGTKSETGSESKDSDQAGSGDSTPEDNNSNSKEQVNKGETPESSDKTADDAEEDADKTADAEADANADKDAEDDDEKITYDYESNNDGTHVKKWVDKDGEAHEETEDCEFGEDGKCIHCGYEKEEEEDTEYKKFGEFTIELDGYTFVATVPEGAFEEVVKYEAVECELTSSEESLVEDSVVTGELVTYKAFDMHFVSKNGNEIEPADGYSVQIKISSEDELEDKEVVHITDEGNAENVDVEYSDGDIEIELESFSKIAIAETDTTKILYDSYAYGAATTNQSYASESDMYANGLEENYHLRVYYANSNNLYAKKLGNSDNNFAYNFSKKAVNVTFYAPDNYVISAVYKDNSRNTILSDKDDDDSTYTVSVQMNEDNSSGRKTTDLHVALTVKHSSFADNAETMLVNGATIARFNSDNTTFANTFCFNSGNGTGSNKCNYGQVYQGLASDSIEDGFMLSDGSAEILFPSDYSTKSTSYSYIVKNSYHTNVGVEFKKDTDGYWTIDSDVLGYTYKSGTNTINTGEANEGFWPYGKSKTHFGMVLPISFNINSNGKVDENDNTSDDTIFRFSGDDDVFVYINNTLVLDLGGIHNAVQGQINFATGEITIEGHNGGNGNASGDSTLIHSADGNIYANEGIKTTNLYTLLGYSSVEEGRRDFSLTDRQMTVVYFERGGNNSNCRISYNFTPNKTTTATFTGMKINSSKNGVGGAKFKLFTDSDCTVDAGLYTATSAEDGTVTFSGLTVGSEASERDYYIKEIEAATDYVVSTGAVWRLHVSKLQDGSLTTALYAANSIALEYSLDANQEKVTDYNTEIKYIYNFTEDEINVLEVDKNAEVQDYNKRVYKLTLSADYKGTEVVEVPVETEVDADVVMVLDASGSMTFTDAPIISASSPENAYSLLSTLDKSKIYFTSTMSEYGGYENAGIYIDSSARKYLSPGAQNTTNENYYVSIPTNGEYLFYKNGSWYKRGIMTQKAHLGWGGIYYSDDSYSLSTSHWSDTNTEYNTSIIDYYKCEVSKIDTTNCPTTIYTNRSEIIKRAASSFVDELSDGSNVSIVTFNNSGNSDTKCGLTNVGNSKNTIKTAIGNSYGVYDTATYPYYGLNNAYNILSNDDTDNGKYLIFFTDGANDGADVSDVAKSIKEIPTTVYAVGAGADGGTLSTVATDSDHVISASTVSEVASSITGIAQSIRNESRPKTGKGVVTDYVDSRFEVCDANGNLLGNGAKVGANDEGTLVVADDGSQSVVWSDALIGTGDNKWSDCIYVKAKETFFGGNKVVTNGPGSNVSITGDKTKYFPQPTVNVKLLEFNPGENEITLWLGDKINGAEYSKWLVENTNIPQDALSQIALSDDDVSKLKIGETVSKDYNAGGEKLGTFSFGLKAYDSDGNVIAITEHTADKLGKAIEEYVLTIGYSPISVANRTIADTGREVKGPVGTEVVSVSKEGKYIVNVVNGSIYVYKRATTETGTKLNNATYKLEKYNEDNSKWTDYNVLTSGATNTDGTAAEEGLMAFNNLGVGLYRLTETSAPSGYAKSEDIYQIEIKRQPDINEVVYNVSITKNDVLLAKWNVSSSVIKPDKNVDEFSEEIYSCAFAENTVKTTFNVVDNLAYTLPETGGSGVYVYTIGGILLMIAGALLLYKNKNNKSK